MKEGESKGCVDFQWDQNVRVSYEIYLGNKDVENIQSGAILVSIFNHSINIFALSVVKVKNTKK